MKKVVLTICVFFFAFNISKAETLKNFSEPTTLNYLEVSPFFKLIRSGNFEAVKAMIDSGVDVNKKSFGLTPLMYAARYNKAKIAGLLIKNGANLKLTSKQGYTALKFAQLSKAVDAIAVIKKASRN